jgi:hypothetical protein
MAYVKLAPYNAPSAWKASATAVLPGIRDIDVIAPYVVPGNSIEFGPGTVVHPTVDGIIWIWNKPNILILGQGPATILNIGGIYSNSGGLELGQFNMMGNVSPDCYASVFLGGGAALTNNLYIHDIYSNQKAGNHFTVYVNGTTTFGAILKYLVFSRCLSEDADGMGFVFYGEGPAPSLEDAVLYRCKVKNAGIAPTRLYVPAQPGFPTPTCWVCGIDISEYGGTYAAESFTKKMTVIKCEVDGAWLNAYHSEFAPAKTDIVYLDNIAKRSGQWANIDPPGYAYMGGFMMPYSPAPVPSQGKTHPDEVIMAGNTGDGSNIRADLSLWKNDVGYVNTPCYDFVLGSNKTVSRINKGNCTGIAVKNGTVWDVYLYSADELPVNQQISLPDGTLFTANFTDFLIQRGVQPVPTTGVMIPLYVYPGAVWDQVIAAKIAHPNVPIACIINSNSGPGTAYDATWNTYINKLAAAGIMCYGYVWCGETNEFDNNRDCTQDVAHWKAWYPGISGIFVDGFHGGYVSTGEAQVTRARAAGYTTVVGNPGMEVAANLLTSVDIACVYDTTGQPTIAKMQSLASTYGASKVCVLAYAVASLNTSLLAKSADYCRWTYVTSDILPNPWDTIPAYFGALVAALDSTNVMVPIGATIYTWVWQDVVRDTAKQNEYFNVLVEDGIKIALCAMYYPWWVSDYALVNTFITRAHSLGIRVFGIPQVLATDLATPTNTQAQISAMLNYNHAYPTAKFDGIQFDVESPGWGTANINKYTNYFRTVKTFSNSYGETLVSQGMVFGAYLDAPYYLKGSDGAAGLAAAVELYKEMDAVDIVGYETTKNALIAHLADGPAVCQANGIVFRCGFELSTLGYFGEIGPLGYEYYRQFAAEMDTYFAGYTMYGGRYVEQYSSLKEAMTMANVFGPGTVKTARAPVTVIPAGLNCQAEIFLGLTDTNKAATSGKISFVSTGAAQTVTFPITMPMTPGQYNVYIDVWAEGYLLTAYIATEPVIIPSGTVGPPVWS